MINKAFLHPAVRERMDLIKKAGDQLGFAPEVTSTFRDRSKQVDLWNKCARGQVSRPVKFPGCSQHEFGFAFDMVASKGARIADQPIPGRLEMAICGLLGICPQNPTQRDIPSAQFTLQVMGRRMGLTSPASDPIHFSVFPASVWDPHMRSEFNLECRTCVNTLPVSAIPFIFGDVQGTLLGQLSGPGQFF